MNETVVQIEATDRNRRIDIEELRKEVDDIGIAYLKQTEDICDVNAYKRVWYDTRIPEFEQLKRRPLGSVIRRPPTPDERLAYGIAGNATYVASVDKDGALVSWFEFPSKKQKRDLLDCTQGSQNRIYPITAG